MRYSSLCDKGKIRKINQDSIYCSDVAIGSLPNLFIVADGMGGHNAGEFASRFAIDYFLEYITETGEVWDHDELLKKGIEKVNHLIYNKSLNNKKYKGMGTTFIAATIDDEKKILYIANVGDSRLYLLGSKITKMTSDHSLVEEMIKDGELTEQEAKHHPKKNIITRAVGVESTIKVDTYRIKLSHTHILLLCSDGLTNMIEEGDIMTIIQNSTNLDNACKVLVETANERGGYDNISVILIETGEKVGEMNC